MFIQLPGSRALIDLRTVKRVTISGAQWEVTINVGSAFDSTIERIYITNADYDYLWSKLADFNGAPT